MTSPPIQPQLVVGLTGPIGSGVSTVSKVLEQHLGFKRFSLSSPIKEELLLKEKKEQGTDIKIITDWRRKLQDIGDEGRKTSPSHWINKSVIGVESNDKIVIDGIRNIFEVEWLRENYVHFFLVAVVAEKETRWGRVQKDYQNDRRLFDRDDKRDSEDKDVPHGQQVGLCVNDGDYVFVNDKDLGSIAAHKSQIQEQLKSDIGLMLNPKSRAREPHEHEVHMAQAYALSHGSRCMKRYVGAVIVGQHDITLSSGYNENPIGMQPCYRQFGYCFKDDLMERELEGRAYVFCPECGHKNTGLQKPWECATCRINLKSKLYPSRNMEKCTAIHAEERAIRSLATRTAEGATMYVTTYPCLQCARYIVDAKITKVVYVEAYPVKESAEYLRINKITIDSFSGFKARAFNRVFKPVS